MTQCLFLKLEQLQKVRQTEVVVENCLHCSPKNKGIEQT